MDPLPELIRWTTSLFAIATAVAAFRALDGRWFVRWLVVAGAGGLVLSHVLRALPAAPLLPAVALVGLVLGLRTAGSPRFAALDDHHWRMLMGTRAVFGALILGACGVGLLPPAFAITAGFGDVLVGALALGVPGSIAPGGHRGMRLLVFGAGLIDFVHVIALQALVLVPWVAETKSAGISLLLPWVVVPILATVNAAGFRLVVKELLSPRPVAA